MVNIANNFFVIYAFFLFHKFTMLSYFGCSEYAKYIFDSMESKLNMFLHLNKDWIGDYPVRTPNCLDWLRVRPVRPPSCLTGLRYHLTRV